MSAREQPGAQAAPPAPSRHLRSVAEGETQETTTLELFFDLVYVFAATQVSHLILHDQTLAGVLRGLFLLVVVWWAWIYTTWMVNWFEPKSPMVRAVLIAVMLASLLMAAALPEALAEHGVMFAVSYVALQVGRNVSGAALLARSHPLRTVFERVAVWSIASGLLWLAGSVFLHGDERLFLWLPALAVDLAAPTVGYWVPGRGKASTVDYAVDGGHFAERCQGFVIIALGESVVVTGATAADAGLSSTVVLCLAIAFLETAALWWLYFGEAAEHSAAMMRASDDPGRLARDAYTYAHFPIVAGVIATAVTDDLLIAEPHHALHGVGLALVFGGPALYLAGENLFRWLFTRTTNHKRTAVTTVLLLLIAIGGHMSALLANAIVVALVIGLVFWELARPGKAPPITSHPGDASGVR